ncbi:lycopene cyclase domain-containing protein [Candidatus Gottesmanbacteria bacterium]|nr:lycopene cyclase domain-containing protein [Candidatus Gottesmanbacteria bacterium]
MPEYAIILLSLFIIAFILQRLFRLQPYRSTKHMILTYAIALPIAVAWDQFAIWRGHWAFGEQFLLGPHIGYMPIEEFGFFFIFPYFGLVVYKLIEKNSSKTFSW